MWKVCVLNLFWLPLWNFQLSSSWGGSEYVLKLHIKEHLEWWDLVQLDKMLWWSCKNPTLKSAKRTLNASHIILQMLVWFLYLTTSWPWHAFLLWINIVIISKVFICFYMFRTSAHLCILLPGMVMNSWWKFFWNMELLLQSCPRYTGNHFAFGFGFTTVWDLQHSNFHTR